MWNWLCLLALLVTCACGSQYGVSKSDDAEWFKRETPTALDSPQLSYRTRQFLRRNELTAGDIDQMHAMMIRTHDRNLAFHLAEMRYHLAKTDDDYAAAVEYAYAYLFDTKLTPPATPYDPMFRWSCDFYNRSLARLIKLNARTRTERLKKGTPRQRRLGNLEIWPGVNELPWPTDEFEHFHVVYDFEVRGLASHARNYGLGVPVIAVRTPDEIEAQTRKDDNLPRVSQIYPATGVLRISGSILDGGVRRAEIDVFNPLHASMIEIDGHKVPLEIDITTPIAWALEQTPSYSGLKAMMSTEEWSDQMGLSMMQPYDPDRIPVVFVHGLMSSPITWVPLFNELLADPILRERCQFWFFRYPTGYPVVYSASILRSSLQAVKNAYDPRNGHAAFQNMVICGHSMGGLLTKLQVLDGGDRLWDVVSDVPLDQQDQLTEEQSALLKQLFYFEPQPYIKRVVFMATPHRGSELATGLIGWIGKRLISLPKRLTSLADSIKIKAELKRDRDVRRSMTGIGNLSPDNPLTTAMAKWKYPDGLPVHSIIGDEDEAGRTGGSDGIVPYWSSHLDGVVSERVVESGHNVQEQISAIREVRRILLLHIAEYDRKSAPEERSAKAPRKNAPQERPGTVSTSPRHSG